VLYPENEKEEVNQFIESQLSKYCQKNQYICDSVGFGATQL
jgi:diphosphomevalonate decarboxylase